MKRASRLGLAFITLLTLAASGCLFSPKPVPHLVLDDYPFPDGPDQVIASFKTAYASRDIDAYRKVLAPNYQFILRPGDVAAGHSDRFTNAEELHVAENMFSGAEVQVPGAPTVPGITGITVATLTRSQPWSDVGASDPDFPLTKCSLYDVEISFVRVGSNTIIVTGSQQFFVSARDSVVNGVVKPFYQLRGQRDLSNGNKGNDATSWGALKRAYQ